MVSEARAFSPAEAERPDLSTRLREVAQRNLAGRAAEIDLEGIYPEAALRALGEAGAYRQHLSGLSETGRVEIAAAVEAIAVVAETCLTTAFCMWCQDACAWYLENTANDTLRQAMREPVGAGRVLGGTGLSNPMKAFSGIEPLRLKGRRVDGGFTVRGQIPFVSNLGADHLFGFVFEVEGRQVMALASCDMDGIDGKQIAHFCALEGTRTWTITFRDAFIPDSRVLADPVEAFLPIIQPGFLLLQIGLGLGVMRDAAAEMRRLEGPLGHVNRFLDVQPIEIEEKAAALAEEVERLARTPLETAADYLAAVRRIRLEAADWTVRAAHGAMLHAGARGYFRTARAQRRLREAYFVAIVTPATKHLAKELAV